MTDTATDYKLKIDYREQRARRFANGIIGLMHDFLPSDRNCYRIMYTYLYDMAYKGNIEIINVPPEMDELNKLQIEQVMLKNAFKAMTPKGDII